MFTFGGKGDFSNTENYFKKVLDAIKSTKLDKYGRQGVEALSAATPVDSGLTASSWYYEIENSGSQTTIRWLNSNLNKGVQIAVILQTGHGTGTGGWVEGRDYINPAMRPVFDQIADEASREVSTV